MLERSTYRYVVAAYLADMLLTLLALVGARWLRVYVPIGQAVTPEGVAIMWPMLAMALVIWTFTLSSFGAYDPRRFTLLADELQAVVAAIGVSTMVFAGGLYFTYRGLSRLLFIYFLLLNIGFCVSARLALRAVLRQRRVRTRAVLIVGAGAVGRNVARSLAPCGWMGIRVAGYLDDDTAKQGLCLEGVPVLGRLVDIERVAAEQAAQEIVIALPMSAHEPLAELVARLAELPVNVKVVPDYSSLVLLRASLERFGGLFLIGLKEPVIGPVDRVTKRVFDLVLAAAGLILLSPLLLLIGALVRLTSPGPVFYTSCRVGEGGRMFGMLKFRTMYRDADQGERDLICESDDGQLLFLKERQDPRITPLGRSLRRYSLDELPQLINVLLGDMSLVGPRPELPALVERYHAWQMKRFAVPQGITGWWQISGRSNKAKHLHVEDDLYYIRNYSMLLDLKILLRTPIAVIRGDGAY